MRVVFVLQSICLFLDQVQAPIVTPAAPIGEDGAGDVAPDDEYGAEIAAAGLKWAMARAAVRPEFCILICHLYFRFL